MTRADVHEAHKLNKDGFLNFILGGNAHVTFKNSETGNRYTYRIRESCDKKVFFVGVLFGSDNENAYSYIGLIANKNSFRWTGKSKIKEDDIRVRVFKYMFYHILKGDLPECIEVWHEGRCGRCGRVLTVPESIESGFGPECARLYVLRLINTAMKEFDKLTVTYTGVPVKDVTFNSAVKLWLGFVWDEKSYRPDDKWTSCTWMMSGKCVNRNRPEFDLSMKPLHDEHKAEVAFFKSHPELNP